MSINETITILRAVQVGLAATISELENFAEPIDLFGNSKTAAERARLGTYAFSSREECVAVLKAVDPEYDTTGLSIEVLRRRITEALARETEATLEATGPIHPDSFMPPGIDPSEENIELANGLTVWFHEVMATREPFVRQFQATRNCDLRCRRPGGACPVVPECHAALTVKEDDE